VSLTNPADGAVIPLNASIPLTASISANGHAISKVQFFDDTSLLGESASLPYSITWSGASTGSHHLSARLLYDAGDIFSLTNQITVWDSTPPGLSASGNGASLNLILTGVTGQHYQVIFQPSVLGTGQIYTDILSLAISPTVVTTTMTNSQQFFRAVALP